MDIATVSCSGAFVYGEAIPCYKETKFICIMFTVHLLGLIASGVLLIALSPPGDTKEVVDNMGESG
ncbi:hypothetical protein [Candidatus Kuenenia sp.]|uniref:hypothetical protein n=1 Tax=Candidatus Kuenenia sp. TaxID=2499824 RepID=UPI00321FC229